MVTLPHEREKMFLDDLIKDSLIRPDEHGKLVVIMTSNHDQINWFANEAHRIAENMESELSKRITLYRERIEFDTGVKILFMSMTYPTSLRGMTPTEIIIMGDQAEFWWTALASGAKIKAVA